MQELTHTIASLGAWNWFILAIVLLSLETVLPGVHLLWFGLAAAFVGLATLGIGMAWPWQVAMFAIVSVLTVFWVRRYAQAQGDVSDVPALNERGQQYIGRTVTVEDAIVGGRGKVRVGDSIWAAQGPDTPKGAHVRITGSDGTVLVVAPALG